MSRAIIPIIVLLALFGLGYFLNTLAYGVANSEETKIQLLNELDASAVFQEHKELLTETIDLEHEAIFVKTEQQRRKKFNWDSYRTSMYFKLAAALRDAGETDAVIQLDRYRAGR